MIPSPLGHAQSPWLLALHTVGTVGISVVEEGGGDGDGDGDGGDGGDGGNGGDGDGDGGDGVDVPSAAANIASVKVHLVSVHTCASGPMLLASSAEHCSNARAVLPFLPFWNGMHFVTKAVSQSELQATLLTGGEGDVVVTSTTVVAARVVAGGTVGVGDGDGGGGDGGGDVPSAAANMASVKVHLVSVHTCASGPMLLASSAEHCSNARAVLPFLPFWNGMHFVTKAVSQPELQAVVAVVAVGTVRRPRFFKHGRVVQSFSAAAGATAKVASNARSAIRMVGVAGMMLVVWSTCKVQQKYWVGRGFEEDSVRV